MQQKLQETVQKARAEEQANAKAQIQKVVNDYTEQISGLQDMIADLNQQIENLKQILSDRDQTI